MKVTKRIEKNKAILKMLESKGLSAGNLIMPFFVREGKNIKKPIASMPGNFQFSCGPLIKQVAAAIRLGIKGVIIFGVPREKDNLASGAYRTDGVVQKAVVLLKKNFPGLIVITDVCLCEYTSHGHCRILAKKTASRRDKLGGYSVDNNATMQALAKTALSHATAGADIVAPSSVIRHQVKKIRQALDKNGFSEKAILSYSAKYASGFYAPFRDAAESAPKFGNRHSYQLAQNDTRQALKRIAEDIREGADIVMVKPALAYLDVIFQAAKFNMPLAAYNVSGEFSMVAAASSNKWVNEKEVILEILNSIWRSGARIIITYHAMQAAAWLKKGKNRI